MEPGGNGPPRTVSVPPQNPLQSSFRFESLNVSVGKALVGKALRLMLRHFLPFSRCLLQNDRSQVPDFASLLSLNRSPLRNRPLTQKNAIPIRVDACQFLATVTTSHIARIDHAVRIGQTFGRGSWLDRDPMRLAVLQALRGGVGDATGKMAHGAPMRKATVRISRFVNGCSPSASSTGRRPDAPVDLPG